MDEALRMYEWLRTQFSDVTTAKLWIKEGGLLKFDERYGTYFTSRALAYHFSNAIEGVTDEEEDAKSEVTTWYLGTKYGPSLIGYIWDNIK